MNKQQHIELIVAMLNELEEPYVVSVADTVAHLVPNDVYYTLYTEIDERWKRAERLTNMAREWAEKIRMEEEAANENV